MQGGSRSRRRDVLLRRIPCSQNRPRLYAIARASLSFSYLEWVHLPAERRSGPISIRVWGGAVFTTWLRSLYMAFTLPKVLTGNDHIAHAQRTILYQGWLPHNHGLYQRSFYDGTACFPVGLAFSSRISASSRVFRAGGRCSCLDNTSDIWLWCYRPSFPEVYSSRRVAL